MRRRDEHGMLEQKNEEESKSKVPDLRAESNEPDPEEPHLMEYLETKVITKGNDQCWVKRLFILTQTQLSCFYESAPHLQDKG